MNPGESSRCLTTIANIAIAPVKFKHFDEVSASSPDFIPKNQGRRIVVIGYGIGISDPGDDDADFTIVGTTNVRIKLGGAGGRFHTATCVAGILEAHCNDPVSIEFNQAIAITGWITYVELPSHELGETLGG
jgi:hypothetical protein